MGEQTQETRGEKIPPCTKKNALYENICTICNQDVGQDKNKLSPPEHPPSVYEAELGEDKVLNSKSEFNRYTIGRLTLGEDKDQRTGTVELGEEEILDGAENKNQAEWERTKLVQRSNREVSTTINLENG